MNPESKKDQLLAQAVGDELVVYDQQTHTAHRLNKTAAVVWRQADGRRTTADLAKLLPEAADGTEGEDLVRIALGELDKSGLLVSVLPKGDEAISRRRLFSIGATLIPVVASIAVPSAQTCGSGIGILPGAPTVAILSPAPIGGIYVSTQVTMSLQSCVGVTDINRGVLSYLYQLDGVSGTVPVPTTGLPVTVTLSGVVPGPHTFTASAVNAAGPSAATLFTFTTALASSSSSSSTSSTSSSTSSSSSSSSSTSSSSSSSSSSGGTSTVTFAYSGGDNLIVIPGAPGAPKTMSVSAWGGQGGAATAGGTGGLGGLITTVINVFGSETLTIRVGGAGTASAGGFGGGGSGVGGSGGGGGASSILRNGVVVVVAGGGGGGGHAGPVTSGGVSAAGGPGGGATGGTGANIPGGANGGGGGTPSVGGAGGTIGSGGGAAGTSGSAATGGAGATGSEGSGGGGGGGLYGGGGGASSAFYFVAGGAGGGGGSSFSIGGGTHTQGARSGNGQIVVTV